MSSGIEQVELTVDSAFAEVHHVAWPRLLEALDVDRTIERQIAEECQGDPRTSLAQLLRHWIDNFEVSWEKLAKALMRLPPFRKTGSYIYNKYVNPEYFTAERIVEELSFIEADWFELAHPFLDDSDRVREVTRSTTSSDEKRLKAMKAWLEYYDEPSWDEVASVLEDCFPEYRDKANKLRKKFLPEVQFMGLPGETKLKPLPELSLQNVYTETGDITDWFALGWFLNVPESVLLDIERQHPRTDNRRQAVLSAWIEEHGEKVTWRALAKAIGKMRGHSGLSKRMKQRASLSEKEELEETTAEFETKMVTDESIRIMSKIRKIVTAKVEDIKDTIGGIQTTVQKKLTSADTQTVQNVASALGKLKDELNELEELPSLAELTLKDDVQEASDVPESILQSMSVIAETEGSFTSNEDYSLDWDMFGCKLVIREGSINPGEKGKIRMSAIHQSGPFQLPDEHTQFVSAVYHISLSHTLFKPAILSLQHCVDNIDEESSTALTFMHAVPTTTSGPPYKFEPLAGGSFNIPDNDNYCMIDRKTFCFYAVGLVIVEKLRSFIGYPVGYALLRVLIANDVRNWLVQLYLIKHLNAYKQYYLSKLKRVVQNDFKKVVLTNDAVTVAVSEENEEAEIIQWRGYARKIVNEWEIVTKEVIADHEKLQLYPDDSPPQTEVIITWSATSKPVISKFRIHILGIEKPYSFLVNVPQSRLVRSMTSTGSELTDGEELEDRPTKKEFINRVANNIKCSSQQFAVSLLEDDEEIMRFEQQLRASTSVRDHVQEFILLFDVWKRQGKNFTWDKIISAVKEVSDMRLAKKLQRKLDQSSSAYMSS